MNSLKIKIQTGFYIIGTLLVVLSAFSIFSQRSIEFQILSERIISDYFDSALEIRRYEKNYFLYKQQHDVDEVLRYLNVAKALLDGHRSKFTTVAGVAEIAKLELEMDAYRHQIVELNDNLRKGTADTESLHGEIRRHGKEIINISESMSGSARKTITNSIREKHNDLIIFIGMLLVILIIVSQLLSRIIIAPLMEMRSIMDAVSQGKMDNINIRSTDREIISLNNALVRMVYEIEIRQKHISIVDRLSSLGTMTSGIAHELNNPLSNISTSCQILLEEYDESESISRDILCQIDQQTERARRIVYSLLEFTRVGEGKRYATFLRPLIEETLVFIRGQVPTPVLIRLDIPDDIEMVIDRQRVQQVFLNLIKNAIEATTDGEIVISARRYSIQGAEHDSDRVSYFLHSLSYAPVDELFEIEVRDTGSGIPESDMSRIFDPFFSAKGEGKGVGLGLFISYEIVKEHGGCIAVESQLGKGSSFFVMLPVLGGTIPASR
ncbi:MAG: ATP-binding protein [Alphaproteobacteria bacterium]